MGRLTHSSCIHGGDCSCLGPAGCQPICQCPPLLPCVHLLTWLNFRTQVGYRRRHRLFLATSATFTILTAAIFAFTLWTGGTIGLLTMVVTLSVVCGFPSAFPMPFLYFARSTAVVCVITAFCILLDGALRNRALAALSNVALLSIVVGLTGEIQSHWRLETLHPHTLSTLHLRSHPPNPEAHCSG